MMRYVAIDLETTGLDPERCQVLEIAAVVETDWRTPVEELPTFRALVGHEEIRGEATALAMNMRLLTEIGKHGSRLPDLEAQLIDLGEFIHANLGTGTVTIAGKNFGAFDYAFLRRSEWWRRSVRHRHRFIDAGNLWWNPATDDRLPDLAECAKRAGVLVRAGHDAVEDCRTVIELVRAKFQQPEAHHAKRLVAQ